MPWNVPIQSGADGKPELRLDPVPHLGGGLVRERHGQDAVGRDALDLDQPFDAVREHARLATARTGKHERGQRRRGDRLALRIVERREDMRDVHGKAADSTGAAGPWRTVPGPVREPLDGAEIECLQSRAFERVRIAVKRPRPVLPSRFCAQRYLQWAWCRPLHCGRAGTTRRAPATASATKTRPGMHTWRSFIEAQLRRQSRRRGLRGSARVRRQVAGPQRRGVAPRRRTARKRARHARWRSTRAGSSRGSAARARVPAGRARRRPVLEEGSRMAVPQSGVLPRPHRSGDLPQQALRAARAAHAGLHRLCA